MVEHKKSMNLVKKLSQQRVLIAWFTTPLILIGISLVGGMPIGDIFLFTILITLIAMFCFYIPREKKLTQRIYNDTFFKIDERQISFRERIVGSIFKDFYISYTNIKNIKFENNSIVIYVNNIACRKFSDIDEETYFLIKSEIDAEIAKIS